MQFKHTLVSTLDTRQNSLFKVAPPWQIHIVVMNAHLLCVIYQWKHRSWFTKLWWHLFHLHHSKYTPHQLTKLAQIFYPFTSMHWEIIPSKQQKQKHFRDSTNYSVYKCSNPYSFINNWVNLPKAITLYSNARFCRIT